MFTGIVTAVGRIAAVTRSAGRVRLTVEAPWTDLVVGESIAVAGACLTVASAGNGRFDVDVIVTTRGRTRLGELRQGDRVNLERALRASDRLGGHVVQGHVDGVGDVTAVTSSEDAVMLDVRVPRAVAGLCVPHGSITLDGVSLTVNALPGDGIVQVALIPHTRDHTTLGTLAAGDRIHVEADLLGKYVHRLLEERDDG